MNFFDQIAAKKKKQGKYKACLTAKWVNLSRADSEGVKQRFEIFG